MITLYFSDDVMDAFNLIDDDGKGEINPVKLTRVWLYNIANE